MNMTGIIIAAAVVGIVGIVIGVLLGIASEKFKVEVDEKEILVRAELPGNNCGGCGYAGCDALAKAIAEGKAKVDQCPVGGAPVGEKIAAIMGVEAGSAEKKVAFVKCKGTCDKATVKARTTRALETLRLFITALKFFVLTSSNFNSSTTTNLFSFTLLVRADLRAALFSFLLRVIV